jgi:cation diffusion facilitator family transporter
MPLPLRPTLRSLLAPLAHVPGPEATAAVLSVVIGVALLGLKFAAYFLTGSAAIFSDALESIVNVVASLFAAYSLALAHTPADPEHPYGHGKVEFLSAGFEGGMIVLAAVVILIEAVRDIVRGPGVEKLGIGLVMMAASMAVNGLLGFYLVRSGKKHGSITLEADGKHLWSDAVTSAAVLVALIIMQLGRSPRLAYLDPITAVGVAVYITVTGIGLLRRSAAGLMDKQDVADTLLLTHILDSHLGPDGKDPKICSYHKLRHRHSGRYHWVDFHIMVPAWWDIDRGHRVASNIEYEIEQALREGNATAHVEPCPEADCRACASAKEELAADERR